MTPEQMAEKLSELEAEKEALLGKVKELKTEKMKIKSKYEDIDPEHYAKLMDENESLKSSLDKLSKQHKADLDKLSNELSSKDAYLQKTLIDDNLTKTLLEAGIKKEQLAPAMALLKNDVKLQLDGTDYKAIISDKALNEYVPEWTKTQTWLNLGTPDAGVNTGGIGASGGNIDAKKYFDKGSEHFSLTKQAEIFKTNPELYNQLKG